MDQPPTNPRGQNPAGPFINRQTGRMDNDVRAALENAERLVAQTTTRLAAEEARAMARDGPRPASPSDAGAPGMPGVNSGSRRATLRRNTRVIRTRVAPIRTSRAPIPLPGSPIFPQQSRLSLPSATIKREVPPTSIAFHGHKSRKQKPIHQGH